LSISEFDYLDDLCLAAQRTPRKLGELNQAIQATSLGVAFELTLLDTGSGNRSITELVKVDFSLLSPLIRRLQAGDAAWLDVSTKRMGFSRIVEENDTDERWIAFGLAAQRCAHDRGVPKSAAAQFVAALGELKNNVVDHSGNAETGIVAFLSHDDGIEFVVVDQGIGLLSSLKQNHEFSYLSDDGAALRAALTDGNSKYGNGIGRGMGFRPIFIGLANAVGELRFRSGDHALTISGGSPSLIDAKIAQKARFQGFLAQFRWRSRRDSMRQQ
jgi:hypothetical protein